MATRSTVPSIRAQRHARAELHAALKAAQAAAQAAAVALLATDADRFLIDGPPAALGAFHSAAARVFELEAAACSSVATVEASGK